MFSVWLNVLWWDNLKSTWTVSCITVLYRIQLNRNTFAIVYNCCLTYKSWVLHFVLCALYISKLCCSVWYSSEDVKVSVISICMYVCMWCDVMKIALPYIPARATVWLVNCIWLTHVSGTARVSCLQENNIQVVYVCTRPAVNGILKDLIKMGDS
jgi:hypothetical protein